MHLYTIFQTVFFDIPFKYFKVIGAWLEGIYIRTLACRIKGKKSLGGADINNCHAFSKSKIRNIIILFAPNFIKHGETVGIALDGQAILQLDCGKSNAEFV